jgi:hypothetical protein
MFQNTEDSSSGSFVQCLAKITRMIVSCIRWHGQGRCYGSIFWAGVRVCSSLYMEAVNYTHAHRVTLWCHNSDYVHVNGNDRAIFYNFSQALYKASWLWILCDPKHIGALLKYFYNFNCIYELYNSALVG